MSDSGISRRLFLAAAGAAALAACSPRRGGRPTPPPGTLPPSGSPTPSGSPLAPGELPTFPPYQLVPHETFPNGKSAAVRFVQTFGTYSDGNDRTRAFAEATAAGVNPGALQRQLESITAPLHAANGAAMEILYAQLGGLDPMTDKAAYMSAMTVFRQHHIDAYGKLSSVMRVADVRLKVVDGVWRVEELASIGSPEVAKPAGLATAAKRVLDHQNIELPDTARWDIYSGVVHPDLLTALASLADNFKLRVSVFDRGHPPYVIDGIHESLVSTHHDGSAVDVWSVDGTPVVEQRQESDPPAARLVRDAVGKGLRLLSPKEFVVASAGHARSSWNPVHNDHVHIGLHTALAAASPGAESSE